MSRVGSDRATPGGSPSVCPLCPKLQLRAGTGTSQKPPTCPLLPCRASMPAEGDLGVKGRASQHRSPENALRDSRGGLEGVRDRAPSTGGDRAGCEAWPARARSTLSLTWRTRSWPRSRKSPEGLEKQKKRSVCLVCGVTPPLCRKAGRDRQPASASPSLVSFLRNESRTPDRACLLVYASRM